MERPAPPVEAAIARVLVVGMYVAIALVATGTALLLAAGRSPLEPSAPFDPGRILADALAFRPEALLWPGIVVAIATPAARVVASLVGYARRGERDMALVAVLILVVIAVGVAVGAVGG